MPVTSVNSDYTILITDQTILADSSSNTIDLTLPSSHFAGKRFEVKDVSGSTTTFRIRVIGGGGDTIDGQSSVDLTVNFQALVLHSDGTNWAII